MSQFSHASEMYPLVGPDSQGSNATLETRPSSVGAPQDYKTMIPRTVSQNEEDILDIGNKSADASLFEIGFASLWLKETETWSAANVIDALISERPLTTLEYAVHLFKVASLLYDGQITSIQKDKLEASFMTGTENLSMYVSKSDPSQSRLYLIVEKCFDVFIKISMNLDNMKLATTTIRFLTTVIMNLNYYEVYNLLRWRPAIYQFMALIKFDLHECYARFMRDYKSFAYQQKEIPPEQWREAAEKSQRLRERSSLLAESMTPDVEMDQSERGLWSEDHQPQGSSPIGELTSIDGHAKDRKRPRLNPKLGSQKVIKKPNINVLASSRSSNYDPHVIHECQLPSPDEPDKVCLRRFSRKYELIRHQETVHSKKKKLFKCYVCVKQDPSIGPRIFTRHDTLAKHIRVNHRISGKEAKAEVAYSKKFAEIVEEGDITVHVGRRKTKVDFELRAHMERKGSLREGGSVTEGISFDDIDDSPPDSIQSGDDEEPFE